MRKGNDITYGAWNYDVIIIRDMVHILNFLNLCIFDLRSHVHPCLLTHRPWSEMSHLGWKSWINFLWRPYDPRRIYLSFEGIRVILLSLVGPQNLDIDRFRSIIVKSPLNWWVRRLTTHVDELKKYLRSHQGHKTHEWLWNLNVKSWSI